MVPKKLIVLTCTLPNDEDPAAFTTTEVVGVYERREDAQAAAETYAEEVRDETGENVEFEQAFKFTTLDRVQVGPIIFEHAGGVSV